MLYNKQSVVLFVIHLKDVRILTDFSCVYPEPRHPRLHTICTVFDQNRIYIKKNEIEEKNTHRDSVILDELPFAV